MQRKCSYEPLSAKPLILALCQVRLSPVPQLKHHIPAIHEACQRRGFPNRTIRKGPQSHLSPQRHHPDPADGATAVGLPSPLIRQQRPAFPRWNGRDLSG